MDILSIVAIATGLAMDSFAISITSGGILGQFQWYQALRIAFFMGLFQGGMPLIGWLLGMGFKEYITDYDHWVAMIVLLLLGGKMIVEGCKKEKPEKPFNPFSLLVLIGLAVATSIDAMAVGLSFAFLACAITVPFLLIGIITFFFSAVGVYIGCQVKQKINLPVEILGGILLILIGLKIVWEHTVGC